VQRADLLWSLVSAAELAGAPAFYLHQTGAKCFLSSEPILLPSAAYCPLQGMQYLVYEYKPNGPDASQAAATVPLNIKWELLMPVLQ
jgi:hypothetical protein